MVAASLEQKEGASFVQFRFDMPAEHVIYADHLHFEGEDGGVLTPERIEDPVVAIDKVTGKERQLYDRPFTAEFKLTVPLPLDLVVRLQGCSNSACYFPEKHFFKVTSAGVTALSDAPAEAASASDFKSDWRASDFKVAARQTGYLGGSDFVKFLDQSKSGGGAPSDAAARFKKLGIWATAALIVLGGAGLNLTPCVLPLIPINLAIIGAGARARSRRRGFALGAVYGSGMALTYGVLGLVVVLTGSKFGTLNSSIWFNLGIALVFAVMSLAMFDLLNIDFTRFQRNGGGSTPGKGSQEIFAFGVGAVAALLAGACVAPVVISVLLLSTDLYSKGAFAGLLLPFLLGLGMALPWPFAGAGLTFLPKPGKWMTWVKRVFGVLILLFACYYGRLAVGLFQSSRSTSSLASAPGAPAAPAQDINQALASALQEARANGRPVFIDFQASWCKNCAAMDETVFNKTNVKARLADFVVVKYQAERPNESPAREVLDRFGVLGLPTYVVLTPQ